MKTVWKLDASEGNLEDFQLQIMLNFGLQTCGLIILSKYSNWTLVVVKTGFVLDHSVLSMLQGFECRVKRYFSPRMFTKSIPSYL